MSMAQNHEIANEFALRASQASDDQAGQMGANVLPPLHRINRAATMRLDGALLNSEVSGAVLDGYDMGVDVIEMDN